MSNVYKDLKIDGYERVVKCVNEKLNFISYISIHSLDLGPGLGGCRFYKYESEDLALADVLSLSRAMTFKNCLADLPYGGGKAVISGNLENKKEILKYMADFINYLNGDYITAEDVNVNCDDLDIIRENCQFVVSKIAGDPSPITAKGVYLGIESIWNFLNKREFIKDFSDTRILVYGVGAVGRSLVDLLLKSVKKIYIYDINEENIKKIQNKHGDRVIFDKDYKNMMNNYDIISPCALGGMITEDFAKNVNTKVIAGCANNQLSSKRAGYILFERGIFYAPDFVINAGGVIQVTGVKNDVYQKDIVEKKLKVIPKTLKKIFKKSLKERKPTNLIADEMVIKKLQDLYKKRIVYYESCENSLFSNRG